MLAAKFRCAVAWMTQRQLKHHGRRLVAMVAERAGCDAMADSLFQDIFPDNIDNIVGIDCQAAIKDLRLLVTTNYIKCVVPQYTHPLIIGPQRGCVRLQVLCEVLGARSSRRAGFGKGSTGGSAAVLEITVAVADAKEKVKAVS